MLALSPLPLDPVTVRGAFIEECTVNLMGPNIPSLSLPLRQHLMLTQSGGTFIEVVTERYVEHR